MSTTAAESRRAARNAGILAAASIFNKGLLFAWQLVLARWLGEAAYGVYGTIGALTVIATVIGSFGMGVIAIRDVSQQPKQAGAYLTAMLFWQTGLGLLAFLAMNGAAWGIGYDDTVRALAALNAVSLLADIIGNMNSDLLLAHEKMLTTSLIELTSLLVRVGFTAAALWAGYDLLGLYVVAIGGGVFRSVLMSAALRRVGVRPAFPLDRGIAWRLFVNSAPLAASAVLLLVYQQADRLISTRLLDVSSTGYLTAAVLIVQGVIELLNTTVLVAVFPMMSRSHAQGGEMFGFIVEKLAFFTALVTLPIALVLSTFAPAVTVPLFGASFAPAASALRVLIWYALLAMLVNVFAQAMMVQNRQRWLLGLRAVGLAVNLGLNLALLLIFDLGIIGLALATVLGEVVLLAALLLKFRQVGADTARLVRRLMRPAAVGAAMLAAMLLAAQVHVLLGMAAGALVYAALVLRGGVLAGDDWDLLYRLVAAMPGGGFVRRYWQRDITVYE